MDIKLKLHDNGFSLILLRQEYLRHTLAKIWIIQNTAGYYNHSTVKIIKISITDLLFHRIKMISMKGTLPNLVIGFEEFVFSKLSNYLFRKKFLLELSILVNNCS